MAENAFIICKWLQEYNQLRNEYTYIDGYYLKEKRYINIYY